jgi:hypothetical protein
VDDAQGAHHQGPHQRRAELARCSLPALWTQALTEFDHDALHLWRLPRNSRGGLRSGARVVSGRCARMQGRGECEV